MVLVLVADDGVLWKVRPDRLKCGSVEVDVGVDVDVEMEVQVQVSDAINAAGGSGRARCRATSWRGSEVLQ